jgi:hypothetical protein
LSTSLYRLVSAALKTISWWSGISSFKKEVDFPRTN